jgi:hypothetical protein
MQFVGVERMLRQIQAAGAVTPHRVPGIAHLAVGKRRTRLAAGGAHRLIRPSVSGGKDGALFPAWSLSQCEAGSW